MRVSRADGAAAVTLALFHPETPVPALIHFAMVMPMSGTEANAGKMMVNAAQMQLDAVNQAGGVDGHRLVLDVFDDEGKPELARRRAQEVAASPAVAVIGHYSSATSIGAGLSAGTLRSVGWRPLLQGVVLWVFISVASLGIILRFV